MRHANRLMETDQPVSKEELTTLATEDLLGGRVFTDPTTETPTG